MTNYGSEYEVAFAIFLSSNLSLSTTTEQCLATDRTRNDSGKPLQSGKLILPPVGNLMLCVLWRKLHKQKKSCTVGFFEKKKDGTLNQGPCFWANIKN